MRQRRRTARRNQSQDVLNLSAVPIPLSITVATIPTEIDSVDRYITHIQNSLTLGSQYFIFINITYVCINITY